MDMNKKDHITTLPKRDLKTRSYNMNMKKEGHITTLPKKGLKTRSYNMDMNKKDLKRLSKSQLIKLLLKQEANEFENSIASPPNQEQSVPHKNINDYEDIVLPSPEQFRDKKDHQNPTDHHHLYHQRMISISTMTYSKPKTKVLKNSK